jgi:alpha-D-ribose 1-methylphosphonate 5-triphosphate synthase subunit PhnG
LNISQIDISPIGVASVRGIESGLVQIQGDRYDNLSPIGVASVRGIESGLVQIQGDRQS